MRGRRSDQRISNITALNIPTIGVAVGVAVWAPWRERPVDLAVSDAADRRSVAVLLFDNLSGDPEQEYFADGITEEIMEIALAQALDARQHILGEMNKVLSESRPNISDNAPAMTGVCHCKNCQRQAGSAFSTGNTDDH